MIYGHGGNVYGLAERLGCRPEDILDMSSNVNPLGPPPGLVEHLRERLGGIVRLPEVDAGGAVGAFSDFFDVPQNRIVAGNGTTQLIYQIPRALASRRVLIVGPTYADYRSACRMEGVEQRFHFAREENGFRIDMEALAIDAESCDTVFVCNPNNPTGILTGAGDLADFCRRFPDKRIVVDESYLPFVPEGERSSLMRNLPDNALVLHSMSKIFRVPGLRIGFLAASPPLIERMERLGLPWSVNAMAQAAVVFLLRHPESTRAFIEGSRRALAEEAAALRRTLEASIPGMKAFPTVTSFLLVRLPEGWAAGRVWRAMADLGILIRNCDNFEGLSDRFIRLSVQTPESNRKAASELIRILGSA
ncbi:MAG: pyridoxal phosphate-dependent aminotransferase [Desulfobacterales bacterium]